VLDYHVHLWPHPERADAGEHRLERLRVYCERARARGVAEIALTEHLFRFRAARAAVGEFWLEEAEPELRGAMAAYFDHHATADLDEYVEAVLDAKRAGLPVVLGLEVDYYPGRMDAVAELLRGYPFDVLLGSVHWLGTWMFDDTDSETQRREWARREVAEVWRAYTDALEELAATGTCDVLAHPDLVKVLGLRPHPGAVEECEERIAEAAAAHRLAAECSSVGWRKPVAEPYPSPSLLARLAQRQVPVTVASDAHGPARVGDRAVELAARLRAAGYVSLRAFRGRQPRDLPLAAGADAAAAG
jgi:histidinol-phosphatase (PHP family)